MKFGLIILQIYLILLTITPTQFCALLSLVSGLTNNKIVELLNIDIMNKVVFISKLGRLSGIPSLHLIGNSVLAKIQNCPIAEIFEVKFQVETTCLNVLSYCFLRMLHRLM